MIIVRDPDAEYDRMVARVDDGRECPECHRGAPARITQTMRYGLPLFACGCGCQWYDFVTRATDEGAPRHYLHSAR